MQVHLGLKTESIVVLGLKIHRLIIHLGLILCREALTGPDTSSTTLLLGHWTCSSLFES